MRRLILVLVLLAAGPLYAVEPADPVWGNDWITGDYHRHDLQLSERVGLSLDWQGVNINGLSLSYSTRFGSTGARTGLSPEEPITFRVTLRGWEVLETSADANSIDYFSFDRIRDRDVRKQLISVSFSKRF